MTESDRPTERAPMQLSRCEGKRRATEFRRGDREDPHPNIPPSLLAAHHIVKYVSSTGAIAPFDASEEARRLKKTTYEGRIGNKAYLFDSKGKMVNAPIVREGNEELVVIEANSIVFAECDLDFRLPDFIALRFNLHIRHVHRGLLLGTGPLVDPGYWGKLCIPLHNLTDENYLIPRTEGLIWIEFTKTSLFEQEVRRELGRDPLEGLPKEYWDIREFIERAARPLGAEGSTVPIRSSIPSMTARAIEDSEKAGEAAAEAVDKARERSKVGQ